MATKPKRSDEPVQEWLCVLELADETGPRRHPSLERVFVQRVRTRPGLELDEQIERRNRWRRKGVTRVRYDLMPRETQPGGLRNPFIVPLHAAAARDAEEQLREDLSAQGYTVNGSMQVWRLYVVELEYTPPAKGAKKIGRVYVGQTKKPVEERVEQHRLGPNYRPGYTNYSRPCHRLFKGVRQSLLPEWARKDFYSECAALRAEGCLHLHFKRLDYQVDGGTELLKGRPHRCGSITERDCGCDGPVTS
jgi:hypothetical protein